MFRRLWHRIKRYFRPREPDLYIPTAWDILCQLEAKRDLILEDIAEAMRGVPSHEMSATEFWGLSYEEERRRRILFRKFSLGD